MFAVMGIDYPPHSMGLRDSVRSEHRDYYLQHDGGAIQFAGALYDDEGNQKGSLIIFEAESAEQVKAWFADEPFFKSGVYKDFHIIEWRQALNRLERTEWPM
jgi:uncharacterized protein YciI